MAMRRLLAALGLLSALAAPAPALAHKTKKPSIKVLGFSINRYYVTKGSTIKYPDPTNACVAIEGSDGEPPDLQSFVYLSAVKIPASAQTTWTFHTPWDALAPDQVTYTGTFGKALVKAKGKPAAQVFGGPTGPTDYFWYRQLPQPTPASSYVNGTYSFSVTVTVGGRKLASSGSVKVDCP
jgi:hypothetical protein